MSYRDQPPDCPRCHHALARRADVGTRDLWRCDECGGALVPEGELIVELLRVAPDLLPEGTPRLPTRTRPPRGPAVTCGQCLTAMAPVFVGGVEVDRCHADEVFWFDGAELERVLARAAAQHEVRTRGWFERLVHGLLD